MLKNILNFLDYVLFLGMMYILYLGLKHGPQIEQLIIELKGGVIWENTTRKRKRGSMIKNILNFLDYVLFLAMFYLIYLGLKHGPQIEQLIIELKGGAIWKNIF